MQADILTNITSWAVALLVFPGLLFVILLALAGEWLAGVLRPLFTPRLYRGRARFGGFLDPLLNLFNLLSRKDAVHWQSPEMAGPHGTSAPSHPAESALALLGAIAPLLALALMPLSGNPVTQTLGLNADLFLVLALLAINPLAAAASQARSGGLSLLQGAQTIGALLTGLLPALLVVTALVQVAGAPNLNMDVLLAAPLTPQQTFARLLSGLALIVALPWWLGRRPSQRRSDAAGAGAQAGTLFQAVALAVLWVVLIVPAIGNSFWSIVTLAGGALFALVSMKLVGERWWPTRRTSEAANLVWATTIPLAAIALALSVL